MLALFSAGLAVAMAAQLRSESGRSDTLRPGTVAPEFALPAHHGGEISLQQLRGKVVMLDFWATWCPPCAEEMPTLVRLAKEYEGRGLAFVAASRDELSGAPAVVGVFDARRAPGLSAYVVFADDEAATRYRAAVLPTLYLIDRSGKVDSVLIGYSSEETLRTKIEAALAK